VIFDNNIDRRKFLKRAAITAAGAVGFPYFVRSSALGKAGNVAASNRIVMGCIGVGGMGTGNMVNFLEKDNAQVVAVCDVDKKHREGARDRVNEKYKNKDCACYNDFRELIDRDDIDAVSLGLPDHWHAIPAIAAAKSGKDVYGEKPFSHNLAEGRAMCEAMKRYGRVWQTGSWQRSRDNFHHACELVRNGRIGKVHTVEVGLPSGHGKLEEDKFKLCPPPEELDYDFWLGPAPYSPYCPARVHFHWRWNLDYGGGQLMDWVGHHVDIAHWGLGLDYTGPVEIEGNGEYPRDGLWNSPTKYRLTAKYANGITMIFGGGQDDIVCGGTKWIGEDGWIWASRNLLKAEPERILKEVIGPDEIKLYKSRDHIGNFLDCIKSRQLTITPSEVAHRSASVGHIGQIAMELGRKLKWNPQDERFINDDEANSLLGRPMRSPWSLL